MNEHSKCVVVAGGGTGGHIYPGLAIARSLIGMGYRVEWVGARGGLEEKIVVKEGLPLHLISIGKLHSSVGFWTQIKTALGLPIAFLQALFLCIRLQPIAVLGVGGFASGPFLFVAALLGKRTVVWEPNAHAGMTNRLLAHVVDECLVVFEDAKADLGSRVTRKVGLPVRSAIAEIGTASKTGSGGSALSPEMSRPLRVLIFGGSQGARAINRTVQTAVLDKATWPTGIELVHQTGRLDFATVNDAYQKAGVLGPNVQCLEYLHDMEERYRWADVVVCRAGASTVAEIAAAGKAAIFVPLPTAADNHQLKNAQVLERAQAARVIEQKDFTPERFRRTIAELQNQRGELVNLGFNALRFATPNADQAIASILVRDRNKGAELV